MANKLVLHASSTETATATGTAVTNQLVPTWVTVQLDVTLLATAVGDTLDVFVQTQIDTTTWIDFIHFTQILGNGSAVKRVAKVHAQTALGEFAVSDALGAAAIRDMLGTDYRVRWAIVSASAPSFTFSVKSIMGFT